MNINSCYISIFTDTDPQLLVIESCSLVGYVWNSQPIFKINKIGLLSLGQSEPEITTHPCSKHSNSVAFNQRSDEGNKTGSRQQEAFAKLGVLLNLLQNRSRAPQSKPLTESESMEERVIEVPGKYGTKWKKCLRTQILFISPRVLI